MFRNCSETVHRGRFSLCQSIQNLKSLKSNSTNHKQKKTKKENNQTRGPGATWLTSKKEFQSINTSAQSYEKS